MSQLMQSVPKSISLPSLSSQKGEAILHNISLPIQPISIVTSHLTFVQTNCEDNGVLIGGLSEEGKCIICRTPFGQINSHGSYDIAVPLLCGWPHQVHINNDGATEIGLQLPCGHVVGNNCILPYSRCEVCKRSLLYEGCGHRIPLFPADPNNERVGPLGVEVKLPDKCLQCRVLEHDKDVRLSKVLTDIHMWKEKYVKLTLESAVSGQRATEKSKAEMNMRYAMDRLTRIETKTRRMIQEAEFGR